MLKKLFTLVTTALLLIIAACTQKYDGFGPRLTEPGQSSTDTTVLISQVAKVDFVSSPKVIISESFMYAGTQLDPLNMQDTVLTSSFLTDFTLPANDSLFTDSVQFIYPLLATTEIIGELPLFKITKIDGKWNTIDDSLVQKGILADTLFSIRLQKDTIGQFAGKYVLKFAVGSSKVKSWRQSQASNDSMLHRFRGLSFTTTHQKLFKFYSNTYPTDLPLSENYRPRFVAYYHSSEDDSSYTKLNPIRLSASLVSRQAKFLTDTTQFKIGGAGGEGVLIKIAMQDSLPNMPNYLPKDAFILTSRLAMDRGGSDDVNGKLNYLTLYALNDSNKWEISPDSVIANITNKRYDSKNPYSFKFYNLSSHPTAYLRETDTVLKNWQKNPKKNFGFYLKANRTISDFEAVKKSESHLGYSIFKNIRFEVTYMRPPQTK